VFNKPYRTVFLISHDDAKYTFSKYMQPGFTHVFAIERCNLGWACIDANRSELDVTILPVSNEIDMMPQYLLNNPNSTILRINIYPYSRASYPCFGVISCVSTMQYLLGVYWPHVFTPYMLYNKLIKNRTRHLEVSSYGRQTR